MKNSSYKHIAVSVTVVILLIISYQVFSICKDNEAIFPRVNEIFTTLGHIIASSDSLLLLSIIGKISIVLAVSFALSLFIHFINYIFKYNVDIIKPLMVIMKAAPFAIVSVYLYILLFRNREIIPYIVCFLVVFPVVYEGVGHALDIDKDIKEEVSLLQGPTYKHFLRIYVPLAISPMLVTFLQGISLGIKVMVMAEYICGVNNSIGLIINTAKQEIDFATMIAWLILLIGIVVIFDVTVGILKKKVNYLK